MFDYCFNDYSQAIDPQVLGQWVACEKTLYDGLEK